MATTVASPAAVDASYKLVYFDIEGRAETSRLLFALSGTKYSDERIDFAEWHQRKSGEQPMLREPHLPLTRLSPCGLVAAFLPSAYALRTVAISVPQACHSVSFRCSSMTANPTVNRVPYRAFWQGALVSEIKCWQL